MIRFPCPRCGDHIEAPNLEAGTCRACPACGETIDVPDPAIRRAVARLDSAAFACRCFAWTYSGLLIAVSVDAG